MSIETPSTVLYIDYNTVTSHQLTCSLAGNLATAGVTTVTAKMLKDDVALWSVAGQDIEYNLSDITNEKDGSYVCKYELDDGAQFNKTIHLIARSTKLS